MTQFSRGVERLMALDLLSKPQYAEGDQLVDEVQFVSATIGVGDLVVDDTQPVSVDAGKTPVEAPLHLAAQVESGGDDTPWSVEPAGEQKIQADRNAGEHGPSAMDFVSLPRSERAIEHADHPPMSRTADAIQDRDRTLRTSRRAQERAPQSTTASCHQIHQPHRPGS